MAFHYFFQLPRDAQNEIISNLTLRERIDLYLTSKAAGEVLNDPFSWRSVGAYSFADFMGRTKALPPKMQEAVLDEELPLQTAEILQLRSLERDKKVLSIYSTSDQAQLKELLPQFRSIYTGIYDDELAILLYEKLMSIADLKSMVENNGAKVIDGKNGVVLFFTSPLYLNVIRKGLITFHDCLLLTHDELSGMLLNGAEMLVNYRKFRDDPDSWKKSGVKTLDEFNERFSALPVKFQIYIANDILSLAAAEMLQLPPEGRIGVVLPTEKYAQLKSLIMKEVDDERKAERWIVEQMGIDFVALVLFANVFTVNDFFSCGDALNLFQKAPNCNGYVAFARHFLKLEGEKFKATGLVFEALEVVVSGVGIDALNKGLVTAEQIRKLKYPSMLWEMLSDQGRFLLEKKRMTLEDGLAIVSGHGPYNAAVRQELKDEIQKRFDAYQAEKLGARQTSYKPKS